MFLSFQPLCFCCPCCCSLMHWVGCRTQRWVEGIAMEILILYLVSENAFKFSVPQCLLWVSFIKWAMWMDVWGKNLKISRHKLEGVLQDVWETSQRSAWLQQGQWGDSVRRRDEKGRATPPGRGRCDCTKQYEDQRKDFGSYCERSQGPAFSRRVSWPDLQLEGSRFEIRMESTGVNSGRPIRRLIGAA